jgi:alpha-beta hydrolase superfamily lysophospholipase
MRGVGKHRKLASLAAAQAQLGQFTRKKAIPSPPKNPHRNFKPWIARGRRIRKPFKGGKCIILGCAKHEILMEADPMRELFWAAFDAFLPGEPQSLRGAEIAA